MRLCKNALVVDKRGFMHSPPSTNDTHDNSDPPGCQSSMQNMSKGYTNSAHEDICFTEMSRIPKQSAVLILPKQGRCSDAEYQCPTTSSCWCLDCGDISEAGSDESYTNSAHRRASYPDLPEIYAYSTFTLFMTTTHQAQFNYTSQWRVPARAWTKRKKGWMDGAYGLMVDPHGSYFEISMEPCLLCIL
jgi:hypothetical protein